MGHGVEKKTVEVAKEHKDSEVIRHQVAAMAEPSDGWNHLLSAR